MNSFTIAPTTDGSDNGVVDGPLQLENCVRSGGAGAGGGGVSSEGSLNSAASGDSAVETAPYSTSMSAAVYTKLPNHSSPKLPDRFPIPPPPAAVTSSFPSPGFDRSADAESQPPTPKDFSGQQTTTAAAVASSDSERSSGGSASVSPGLRRAAGDRLRGAWSSLLRKSRRGTASSSSSSNRGRTPPESIEISSPTVVDLPGMRAKMDALHCIDLSPLPDQDQSTPLGYRTLPCPRLASTPTSPLTTQELAAALRTTSGSPSPSTSSYSSSSLWSRRRQQPLVLDQVGGEGGQPRSTSTESASTVTQRGSGGATAVRKSVYDNVDSPPSTADPQSELDAILTSLYRDISMLSCSLAVVKEEHTGLYLCD